MVRKGSVSPQPGCAMIRSGTNPDVAKDDNAYRTCSARWHSISKRLANGWVADTSTSLRLYFKRLTPLTACAVEDPMAAIRICESLASARAMCRYWPGKLL